jgi:hypothetical protein
MTTEQIEEGIRQLCRLYDLHEVHISVGLSGKNYTTSWGCSKGTRISYRYPVFSDALADVMVDAKAQIELNEWRLRAGA